MQKIKKIGHFLLFLLLMLILFKGCIRADIPEKETVNSDGGSFKLVNFKYPGSFKTVYKNRLEYRIARGEIGKYGGVLYSSTIGEGPKTFNLWTAMDATSSDMTQLMFDGLVSTDAYTGEVIPLLAKSYEIKNGGKEYIFRLRKGLKWSDGKPITADDVVFTWKNLVGEGYGNTSARDNMMINGKFPLVEKVDNLTVRFILSSPFSPFLIQLSEGIAPKHVFYNVYKQGRPAFSSYWGVTTPPKNFVTSGMFRLKNYVPAQRVEFVRNPNYYEIDRKGQKLPYLDNYTIFIVGDINNEILKFEGKEIDMLSVRGSNVARLREFEKNSDYKMYNLGPDTGTLFLSFNMNNRKNSSGKYYLPQYKQGWFRDLNFRKAVDYAVDRESIISDVLSGVGAPLFTAEPLTSIFLNQKLKNGHPRNLETAKILLEKSGFYWDKKGVLHDKKGNIVEFTLYTNAGNTEREAVGVMIKQDLQELGMKVNFKPIEFNVLVGKMTDSFDWDAIIIGLTGSTIEPHGGRNVWQSSGSLHLFNQRSEKDLKSKPDLFIWEKELDNIFEEGAKAQSFKDRKKIYDKYQQMIYDNLPLIYLYSPLRVYAVRKKFGNMNPTPLGGPLHNLDEIFVKVH
jgi:peptide/nickel transport system substrate-binding protein